MVAIEGCLTNFVQNRFTSVSIFFMSTLGEVATGKVEGPGFKKEIGSSLAFVLARLEGC